MGIATALIGSAIIGGVAANAAANKAKDASNKATAAISQQAETSAEIAGRQQDLAELQYSDSRKIYEEYAPILRQQLQTTVAEQQKSVERGDQQWSSYQQLFAPAEAKLANASLEFDTPQRREQAAGDAVGQVSNAFDIARAGTRRSLADAGIKVGTGAATALDAQSRIEQAKASAGASNQARADIETRGLALLDNTARLGRNLPSTGIQTAALGGQQGQQVQGAYGTLSSASAAPTAAAISGLGQAANTGANSANLYLNAFNAKNAGINTSNAIIGDALGAGLTAYGMYSSSEKLKDMGDEVDGREASDAVEKTASKRWRYRPGLGDANTKPRMGPTAESLAAVAPEVSDGKQVDGIALHGLHHAAIGDHSKRLRRLEQRLSLADAKPARKAA